MCALCRPRPVDAGGGVYPFSAHPQELQPHLVLRLMDAGQETHIGGIAAVAAVVSAAVRRPNPQHDRASDSLCFVCPLRSCLMYAGCVDCSSHLSSSLQPGPWFSYARSSLDACSCACRAVPWPSMICRFYTGLACFVKYHVFERAGCHINVDWWVRG